jgi:hypothetical protein
MTNHTSGLTPYICGCMGMTTSALRAMDIDKMAKKYGIRRDWAVYYRDQVIKGK